MATLKQFKSDIRKAKAVYAGVLVSTTDLTYIQVVKSDLLLQIANWESFTEMNYRIEADGSLYIN